MRYTKAKARINRRFNFPVFSPKKACERKPYIPGMHGPKLRRKVSDYSLGLNEKQKLRFMYGLSERQFRLAFEKAKKVTGVTGEIFLQALETRLDSVVYNMGFAKSRSAARQFVNHGHVFVNGKKLDVPSYSCKPGDQIEIKERVSSRKLATRCLEESQFRAMPPWVSVNPEGLKGVIDRLPIREEMIQGIKEQLIVEFYSR